MQRIKVPRKKLDVGATRTLNLDTQLALLSPTTLPATSCKRRRQNFHACHRQSQGRALPEHDGRLLLVSLENPRALLTALSY